MVTDNYHPGRPGLEKKQVFLTKKSFPSFFIVFNASLCFLGFIITNVGHKITTHKHNEM